MNYHQAYDNLIETRKIRIPDSSVYYEQHHIIPRSMGGDNSPENIVKLTAREHFLAHWMLWRIHKNRQMAFAFCSMTRSNNRQKRKFSSIGYQEAREALSLSMKGNSNGSGTRSIETREKMSNSQKGIKKSEQHKLKNSISHMGNSNRKGKPCSVISKLKNSESHIGKVSPNKGKKMSDDQKLKISAAFQNRKINKTNIL